LSNSDEHKKSDSSDGNLQPHHAKLDKANNDEENKDKKDSDDSD
jgi:hypothetical protein